MFPYITLWATKLYMTGIWIISTLLTFIIVSSYLCNKYKQHFWSLFYYIPVFIILWYVLWSYTSFVFTNGLIPQSWEEILILLSPHSYPFHLIWIILWITIWFSIFLKKITRFENKKVRIDILFFSTAFSIIPLGFFLLLGDDFIGKVSTNLLSVKSLHIDSELNKFSGVFPIGLFLTIGSLISISIIAILKRKFKQFWLGIIGFMLILSVIWTTILFQQYPRHWIISLTNGLTLDIKHYIIFLVIMYCLMVFYKRKNR